MRVLFCLLSAQRRAGALVAEDGEAGSEEGVGAVQLSFATNEGASDALALLQPIYEQYADSISFADLIVYASTIAVEAAGGPAVPFCPGRVDAEVRLLQ